MRKNIPCPQIVQQYSKTMGGVNLTDMLLSLYRIPCKAKHWYQRYSGILLIWQRPMLGPYTVVTFVRMGNHTRIRNFCSNSVLSYQMLQFLPTKWIHPVQEDSPQNEEVRRHISRGKSLLRYCLSPMFVLIKSHMGQALLPTKINADYAVWRAECNVPNARSLCFYWLIATVLLISIQNRLPVLAFCQI